MVYSGTKQWKQVAAGYLLTATFCFAIAVLLSLMGMSYSFNASLIISLCIGLSINTAFVLLSDRLNTWESWYLGPIIISMVGLGVGLIIAGLIILRDPWFFFSSDYSSLIAGVFFGIVGFLIFSTREQLLKAQTQLAEAETSRLA